MFPTASKIPNSRALPFSPSASSNPSDFFSSDADTQQALHPAFEDQVAHLSVPFRWRRPAFSVPEQASVEIRPDPRIQNYTHRSHLQPVSTSSLAGLFQEMHFKLRGHTEAYMFPRNVPISQHVSIEYLLLGTCDVFLEWTPRFIARTFPCLERLEVPYTHVRLRT